MTLAAPNYSLVKARIKGIKKNSKISADLVIIESKDVEGLPNFTRSKVGKEIQVFFNEIDESHLLTGECINGIYIKYIGDERGGRFLGKFSANEI
jgi:hypothetical protein